MLYRHKYGSEINFEALTPFHSPLKKRADFWHMSDMKKVTDLNNIIMIHPIAIKFGMYFRNTFGFHFRKFIYTRVNIYTPN